MSIIAIEKKNLEAFFLLQRRVHDFIHLTMLWHQANEGRELIPGLSPQESSHLQDTLRTASLGWLASLVDPHPSAVNAFKIWPSVFPHKKSEIEIVEAALTPYIGALQTFRSAVAFHGNKSVKYYQEARDSVKAPGLIEAIDQFLELAQQIEMEQDAFVGLREQLESMLVPVT